MRRWCQSAGRCQEDGATAATVPPAIVQRKECHPGLWCSERPTPAEGVPSRTLVLREAHASGRSAIQDSGAQRGPCQRPSFQGRLTLLVAALAAGDQVRPVLIYHLKILGPLRIVLNLLCLCSVNEQQSWDDSNLLHSLLF